MPDIWIYEEDIMIGYELKLTIYMEQNKVLWLYRLFVNILIKFTIQITKYKEYINARYLDRSM